LSITTTLDKWQKPDTLKLSAKPKMPKVPRVLMEHPQINYLINAIIEDFNPEEQQAIILYHVGDIPISELETLTGLSSDRIISVVVLHAERLASTIDLLKKAINCDDDDALPIGEVLLYGHEGNVRTSLQKQNQK